MNSSKFNLIRYVCLIFSTLILYEPISAQQYLESAQTAKIDHITYGPNMMAGGVSIFDFNNDGYEDIYLTGGEYADHLYKNLGTGNFEDVTKLMGLDQISERYTMGVVAGDLDNDGFTDLFVTTYKGEQNICLRNMNGQRFEDVTQSAGFFGEKWSTTVTMADPDLDGDLDIYVSNFVDFTEVPFFFNISSVEPNYFFENKGNWQFKSNPNAFQSGHSGGTLAASFTDVDHDMDADLFIVNDFGTAYTPNELYINQMNNGGGELQLIENGANLEVDAPIDGMGISIGDINGDGYFDYYISDIGDNLFYLGGEGPSFVDVSNTYNINDGLGSSWGSFFADMNNDSYIDLYVAKGTISESDDSNINKLYQYDAVLEDFIDISSNAGVDNGYKARGNASGDLNNDGLMDMVVNNVRIVENNAGKALLYINQQNRNETANFLKLKLEGVVSNRSAYGSYIELFIGERKLIREVRGGSSYLSNNSSVAHFGLGNQNADSLIVHWPAGLKQTFHNIETNTFFYLKEGETLDVYDPSITTSTQDLDSERIKYSIFPNPAHDKVAVQLEDVKGKETVIRLINQMGQAMESRVLVSQSSSTSNFDLSDYGPGLYYLHISNGQSQIIDKILVLQ